MNGFWDTYAVCSAVNGSLHGGSEVDLTGVFHDTREPLEGGLYVALQGDCHDGHDWCNAAVKAGAAAVLVEHACDLPESVTQITVANTRSALLQLARMWSSDALGDVKKIAITGTAGKTTTKDLLHAIGAAAGSVSVSPRSFNNDIGVPLTLLGVRPCDALLIAEVGTNAPGEIQPLAEAIAPHVTIITLIGHGHLEGFGTLADVQREKYVLAEATRDLVLLGESCGDDPDTDATIERFGFGDGCEHRIQLHEGLVINGELWPAVLPGRHGAMNIAAAVCAARAVGIGDDAIRAGLESATISAGRFDMAQIGSMTVIDDTWNSNPESLEASLSAALDLADGRPLAVVLGAMLELGTYSVPAHERMGELLRAMSLEATVLVGEEARPALNFKSDALFLSEAQEQGLREASEHVRGKDRVVLVKGSRSLRLERVIEFLREGTGS